MGIVLPHIGTSRRKRAKKFPHRLLLCNESDEVLVAVGKGTTASRHLCKILACVCVCDVSMFMCSAGHM